MSIKNGRDDRKSGQAPAKQAKTDENNQDRKNSQAPAKQPRQAKTNRLTKPDIPIKPTRR